MQPALEVWAIPLAWLLDTMPHYTFLRDVWKYITDGLETNDQSACKFLAGKYPDNAALTSLSQQMEHFMLTNTAPCDGEAGKQLLTVRP